MLIWLMASALASDRPFPEIAKSDGMKAVKEALDAEAADTKNPKKLQAALAERDLKGVTMPLKLGFGADLVLSDPVPLKHCTYDAGAIACKAAAKTSATPPEYQLTCESKFGAKINLEATQSRKDAYVIWTVHNVETCWELGGVRVSVQPASSDALEGVGEGTEFIPPELTGLTWEQVEAVILEHRPAFHHCHEKAEGERGVGKLVIAFEIAEKGGFSSVTVDKSSTYTSSSGEHTAIEQCILERFKRIQTPPQGGGYERGTFPLVFQ